MKVLALLFVLLSPLVVWGEAYKFIVHMEQGPGHGTAFCADGHIITAAHCVPATDRCYIKLKGEWKKLTFVRMNKGLDIALFKKIDGVKELKIGKWTPGIVEGYGNNLGGGIQKRTGVIIRSSWSEKYAHQFAAAFPNPYWSGSSGGPVIQDGKVVGMFSVSLFIYDVRISGLTDLKKALDVMESIKADEKERKK